MGEPKGKEKSNKEDDKKAGGSDKKYFRDGARYVCNKCKAKFFTKDEVEKCHDAHPATA